MVHLAALCMGDSTSAFALPEGIYLHIIFFFFTYIDVCITVELTSCGWKQARTFNRRQHLAHSPSQTPIKRSKPTPGGWGALFWALAPKSSPAVHVLALA